MSEYGCITNTRTFKETSELYTTEMTKVFSGGLVYEYSQEGNGYGVVSISGSTVSPVGNQFSYLQSALANATNPTDGGGYTTSSTVQDCPDQSDDWDTSPFTGTALPAMPTGAETYMKNGAGSGPGLTGDGSQDAGDGSSSTAASNAGAVSTTYGSGASSTGGSSTSKAAANAVQIGRMDFAPLVCGAVVFTSMLCGAILL